MNMKLLAVVIPPSIYSGCSTRKTLWERKFAQANMRNCGRRSVWKHREVKDGEKYITLDISLNFGSLDKMKIASSEPKEYSGRPGKGWITSLGVKTIRRSKKDNKARYAITNVSLKDLSKIIKEFEDLTYGSYVQKRSKHMHTDSFFYLAGQFAKCTMIFNMRIGPVRMQMTNTQKMNNTEMSMQKIPNLHVCYLDEIKSKGINVNESLSHVCSMDERKSERVIVNACSSGERK